MEVVYETKITCPFCSFSEVITMPDDRCITKFVCTKCGKQLTPKDGDCCVFCSYAEHPCPSIQRKEKSNRSNALFF
ncbi:MAG: GDCCVxC domain-containing (seleno)protein [Candidatus Heimdallarchaeaceae archaeon]